MRDNSMRCFREMTRSSFPVEQPLEPGNCQGVTTNTAQGAPTLPPRPPPRRKLPSEKLPDLPKKHVREERVKVERHQVHLSFLRRGKSYNKEAMELMETASRHFSCSRYEVALHYLQVAERKLTACKH